MSPWFWFALWVLALTVVGVLYVRERRSGRRAGDGDRLQHDAVRQAGVSADIRGPNGFSSLQG